MLYHQPEQSIDHGKTGRCWAVVLRFEILDGFVEEWLSLLYPVLDNMSREEGFVSTSLCADPDRPNSFMLFEVWRSRREFFEVEAKRRYRQAYLARCPDLLKSEIEVQELIEYRTDSCAAVVLSV